MPRSRRGPSLYELAADRTRHAGRADAAPIPVVRAAPAMRPAPIETVGESSGWAGGGRSIRVPMGYVFLAGGVAFALFIIAYLIGAQQGRKHERDRYARDSSSLLGATSDPLDYLASDQLARQQTGAANPTQTQQQTAQPGPGPRQAAAQTPQTATQRPPASTGRLVDGMNYYILARLSPDEAHRAATFLRANGLDVGVFRTDNPRFREVIAMRGFAAGSGPDGVFGEESNRLKSEIRRVGRLYKSQQNGPTDFNDVYPLKIDSRRSGAQPE